MRFFRLLPVALAVLLCSPAFGQAQKPAGHGGSSGGLTLSGSTAANRISTFKSSTQLQGFADFIWDEVNGELLIGGTADDGTGAAIQTNGGDISLDSTGHANGTGILLFDVTNAYPSIGRLSATSDLRVAVGTAFRILGSDVSTYSNLWLGGLTFKNTTTPVVTLSVANSGTNTGLVLQSANTLSGSTLLLDIQNNTTSKWKLGNAGDTTQLGGVTATTGTFSGAVSATALTASGLTAGRIPIVSTAGLLADDSSLTWDATNHRLKVGTIAGTQPIELGTGEAAVTMAVHNSNAAGYPGIRFYDQANTLQGTIGFSNSSSSAPFTAGNWFWNVNSNIDFLNNGASVTATIKPAGTFNSAIASGSRAFEMTEGALVSLNGTSGTSYVQGNSSTHGVDLKSNVTDSGANFAYRLDTVNNLSSAGTFQLLRAGSNIFNINQNGLVAIGDNTHGASVTGSNSMISIVGQPTDGAGAVGIRIRASNALSTVGALIADFQNGVTTKASIDKDGLFQTVTHKTCAMSASASCTATVPTGSVCICQAQGSDLTGGASACGVSSTTATCTAAVNNSNTWNVWTY